MPKSVHPWPAIVNPRRPLLRFVDGAPAGGDPTPPAAPAAPVPTPPAAPTAPVLPPPAPTPTEPAKSELAADPYIRELRDENAARRVAEKEAKDALSAANAKLAAFEAKETERARTDKVRELATGDLAADTKLLLNLNSFTTKLSTLDVSNVDAIKAAIKEELDANPALKTAPTVPGSSGNTEHRGGQSPNPSKTLSDAVTAALAKGK